MSGKWEAEECFAVRCRELFWFQFALPTLRLEGLDGCLVFPGLCVCRLAGGGGVLLRGSGLRRSEALLVTASYWKQYAMVRAHASVVCATSYSCPPTLRQALPCNPVQI